MTSLGPKLGLLHSSFQWGSPILDLTILCSKIFATLRMVALILGNPHLLRCRESWGLGLWLVTDCNYLEVRRSQLRRLG